MILWPLVIFCSICIFLSGFDAGIAYANRRDRGTGKADATKEKR